MVLAMGLVFVLLLGEIDLSAGFTAGTGAAILGVTLTEHGWAWPLSVLAALATGVAIGFTIALLVARLGHPELRRVAGLLPRPAGRDAADHRRGRDDPDPQRRDPDDHEQEHAGRARLAVRADRHRRLRGHVDFWAIQSRRKAGLPTPALSVWAVEGGRPRASSCSCSSTCSTRSASARTRRSSIQGVPWVVPLVAALVVGLSFLLMRTGFGRHVYAVGGNAEAARRAGIGVAEHQDGLLHPLLDAGGRRGHPDRQPRQLRLARPPAARRRCCTRSARR